MSAKEKPTAFWLGSFSGAVYMAHSFKEYRGVHVATGVKYEITDAMREFILRERAWVSDLLEGTKRR